MSLNPYYACPDDTPTVESLQEEVEQLSGKVFALLQFVNEQFDAAGCENCGLVHRRRHMIAVYGVYRGSDGKPHPESSRWFCGFCCHAAMTRAGNYQQECRERIGRWLATGYGRQFLEKESGPVTEFLRQEFAPEITAAARRSR